MEKMLQKIREIHRNFQFKENGGEDMLFRMNLMMEEMGEISSCLTKNKGNIKEEHADLLILLLGNCIALDIDIEKEFWEKANKMLTYNKKEMNGHTRLISKE